MFNRELSAKDVLYARAQRGITSATQIGKKLGVNRATISALWNRRTYQWVTDENSMPPPPKKASGLSVAKALIESGKEWVDNVPPDVAISIRSLRQKGYNIRRVIRYEIID